MTKAPLRVVFAGTPDFAQVILQALIDAQTRLNLQLVAVYTQPDRKAGRGQKLTASPVKQLAQAHAIPVQQPTTFSLKQADGRVSRETLASYRPDVMIVAAYGLILPRGVLKIPAFGCVNVHASLLPRWRGAAPIQRAILAGDTITGITIIQMNEKLDGGAMLASDACPIDDSDTSTSLHKKLAQMGAECLLLVLGDLPNYQQAAKVQQEIFATYADKISKDEGRINWQHSACRIYRQIRALNTFSFLYGDRVKVLSVCLGIDGRRTQQVAGEVVEIHSNGIGIACGENAAPSRGLVYIDALQWASGKPLTAEAILQGKKLRTGDCFDSSTPNIAENTSQDKQHKRGKQ